MLPFPFILGEDLVFGFLPKLPGSEGVAELQLGAGSCSDPAVRRIPSTGLWVGSGAVPRGL